MAKEIEIKLRVRDPRTARRALRALGFRVCKPREFEHNTLFDTAGGSLRRRGLMLRLRTTRGQALLTFKSRSTPSAFYKIRREVETHLSSPTAAGEILLRLGFSPSFRYEKYRTHFARRHEPGEVALDETPIGTFLELEGAPAWIRRVARALGRTPREFITGTYAELYQGWRRRNRAPARAMVFRHER